MEESYVRRTLSFFSTNISVAKDQLQLLLRNSLQILSIVKAKFSTVDFDGPSDLSDYSQTSSDAEALACKWKYAKTQVEAYQDSDVAVKSSLTALYAVSVHPSFASQRLMKLVFEASSTSHEQHCKQLRRTSNDCWHSADDNFIVVDSLHAPSDDWTAEFRYPNVWYYHSAIWNHDVC